ncbi:MAG: alkaline phosphatase family protein, partial [Fidelibacterota bacterium]
GTRGLEMTSNGNPDSRLSQRDKIRSPADRNNTFRLGVCLILWCCHVLLGTPLTTQNVVIVIIDGARYSETFGDTNRTYIPVMDNLALEGTYLEHFYNDSFTYTSRALPALWCGTWTGVRDTLYEGVATKYAVQPTLFEYFRRQTGAPAEKCYYVLKYITSLWLPSFHSQYGPQYWPTYHSVGSTDVDVLGQALWVMDNYHPQLLWIYLADVDGAGHSGDWSRYTSAIQTADSIVGVIWDALQNDPFYADQTTMFVTNDHGRHDDQHGGFSGHGDGCDGCRHIMFLAVGLHVRQNQLATQVRCIPDMAVTAADLLGVDPEYATGEVMEEMFVPIEVQPSYDHTVPPRFILYTNYPNTFNPHTTIRYELPEEGLIQLAVFDMVGREIVRLMDGYSAPGSYQLAWNGRNQAGLEVPSGLYLARLNLPGNTRTIKMVLLR